MKYIQAVKDELEKHINVEKAEFLPKFFQVFPGGYGEGDQFIGVTAPNQRKVARGYYKNISLAEILLQESIHEY